MPIPKQRRCLWLEIRPQVPIDSRPSPTSNLRVGTTERRTARERRSIAAGPSSGPERGVRRPQNNVPGRVDASACALRLPTPEEEDYGLQLRRHCRDDRRGQVLPARVRVAPCLAPTDGEDGVQEKDAVAGPGFERRVAGWASVWRQARPQRRYWSREAVPSRPHHPAPSRWDRRQHRSEGAFARAGATLRRLRPARYVSGPPPVCHLAVRPAGLWPRSPSTAFSSQAGEPSASWRAQGVDPLESPRESPDSRCGVCDHGRCPGTTASPASIWEPC